MNKVNNGINLQSWNELLCSPFVNNLDHQICEQPGISVSDRLFTMNSQDIFGGIELIDAENPGSPPLEMVESSFHVINDISMIQACLISDPGLDECFWIEGFPVGELVLGGIKLHIWMEEILAEYGIQVVSVSSPDTLQISLHYFPGEEVLLLMADAYSREGKGFRPFFCRDDDGTPHPVAWVGSVPRVFHGHESREIFTVRRLRYPWDLLSWNDTILQGLQPCRDNCLVSSGSYLSGIVRMGDGCEILPGAVMEGSVSLGCNCRIGPNCYIRGHVSIGDHCRIGQGVEIKSSIIGSGTSIPHLSYVGDSVIGSRVNLAAGTICSNYRHDAGEHLMAGSGGCLHPTGRIKLGAVIGHDVKTGCHTTIYPGRIIAPGKTTLPGEVVSKNIM